MGSGQTQVKRFDVILENGTYLTAVPQDHVPQKYEHILAIQGWFGVPFLGWFLRNHWAKKAGAQLPGKAFSE